jgi:uncharacterized protein YjbI with pentapeptide repeats
LATLQDATLEGANLEEANLNWANLQNANLQDAILKWANLELATLQGANLSSANLEEANLKWANLVGANLVGANLEGANLVGANLEGAILQGDNGDSLLNKEFYKVSTDQKKQLIKTFKDLNFNLEDPISFEIIEEIDCDHIVIECLDKKVCGLYDFDNINDSIQQQPTSPITRVPFTVYHDNEELKIGNLLTVQQFLKLYPEK